MRNHLVVVDHAHDPIDTYCFPMPDLLNDLIRRTHRIAVAQRYQILLGQ